VGFPHNLEEWRVFSDAVKPSLKDVLLHNGNATPWIPGAHSVAKKESCESM